ncbi:MULTISPECIES: 4Fe-4S dicluster domain-containing protein [unclassified Adlercreutzia]|uniref:4Fe-4S dicluster domain-containing protein n=1 Tax=unclassified Adlercreutzia TaxID=2636013 RepID=UPI0013EA7697|nr:MULTISPECIES: 4Fe-4S dicluster domain-containing protein [unclassified Adlercreutzia]
MSKQYGFYVDTDKCIKCWACEIACKQWNGIQAGTVARRKVHEVTTGTFPNVTRKFISLSCMHCANPACASVCPAGAITKRSEDGIVVVDKNKCIGCHYCFMACPFGVPQYTDEGMEKCDCCIGNGVTPGDTPHCVMSCPTQALQFGELAELGDAVSQMTAAEIVGTPLASANATAGPTVTAATVVMTPDELAIDDGGEKVAAVNSNGC